MAVNEFRRCFEQWQTLLCSNGAVPEQRSTIVVVETFGRTSESAETIIGVRRGAATAHGREAVGSATPWNEAAAEVGFEFPAMPTAMCASGTPVKAILTGGPSWCGCCRPGTGIASTAE